MPGCTYHLFNGLDAEFVAATTGFIDRYNGTSGPPVARQLPGLVVRRARGIRAGWGINFTHQGDSIFASWFTFDLTGKGVWLVMTATKTGNADLYGNALSTDRTGLRRGAVPALGQPRRRHTG